MSTPTTPMPEGSTLRELLFPEYAAAREAYRDKFGQMAPKPSRVFDDKAEALKLLKAVQDGVPLPKNPTHHLGMRILRD